MAVHLGQDFQDNLLTTKNTDFDKAKQLFDVSQKLMLNQSDKIIWISTANWSTIPWMRTTLLHDRAVKLSKAKVPIYAGSVLCLGIFHEHPRSTDAWKDKF